MLLSSKSHGSVAKCADDDEGDDGEEDDCAEDRNEDGPGVEVRRQLRGTPVAEVRRTTCRPDERAVGQEGSPAAAIEACHNIADAAAADVQVIGGPGGGREQLGVAGW